MDGVYDMISKSNPLMFHLFKNTHNTDAMGNPNWKISGSGFSWKKCTLLDFNGNTSFSYAANLGGGCDIALYNQDMPYGGRNFTIRCWFAIDAKAAEADNKIYDIIKQLGVSIYYNKGYFYIDNQKITITKGVWHHVAICYNYSYGRLYYYLDGKLYTTVSSTKFNKINRSFFDDSLRSLAIGSLNYKGGSYNTWEYFKGWLKDFQYWYGVDLYNGSSNIDVYADVDTMPNNAAQSSDYQTTLYDTTTLDRGSYIRNAGDTYIQFYHGNLISEKQPYTVHYCNPIKYRRNVTENKTYFHNDNSQYLDGTNGFYTVAYPLFNKDFSITIESKPNKEQYNRTLLCLRQIDPMTTSADSDLVPIIKLTTNHYNGVDQKYSLVCSRSRDYTRSGYGLANLYINDLVPDKFDKDNYTIVEKGYRDITIITLAYKKSENTIYVYFNGKLEITAKLVEDISGRPYYICIGFDSINYNYTKFIGYINAHRIQYGSFIGNNENIIPSIYAGRLIEWSPDLENKYKDALITNKENYDKLIVNDLDFLKDKAQVIGNISYKDNISTETYNNIVYNNNVDKFAEGFLLSSGAGIFSRRPMELGKGNFTISCWIKKNGNSTVIPFRLIQHHPTQITTEVPYWPYINDIYVQLDPNQIIFKNVIHERITGAYSFSDEKNYISNAKGTDNIYGGIYNYSLDGNDKRQLKYSLENLWNHVAIVKNGNDFYLYINGNRLIIMKGTTLNYAHFWYYLWIGGNTGSFYMKDFSIKSNFVECKANQWPEYYGEEVDFNFTNAKFTFDSNINDSNTNNTWILKGNPTIKTGLTFDTFNTIKNLAPTSAMYIDGQGMYLRNPIKLFDKDFTISGWFYTTGIPGRTSYKNLIKITQLLPTTVGADKLGRDGDLEVSLFTQSYLHFGSDGVNSVYSDFSLGIGGYFQSYKDWWYKYSDAREGIINYNVFTQKNLFHYINYGHSSSSEAADYEDFESLYSYDMKDYWCHICLCYKVNENKLYLYYNGKLVKADEFKVINDVKNKNYYILLGMSFYDNGEMCFKGYVKNFEVIYGTAKYTGETIPEIYTNQMHQFFRYKELIAGVYDYYDFPNINVDSDLTNIYINSETELHAELFRNIFNEKIQVHDTSNIVAINTPQIMEYNIDNTYSEKSVYFDGNFGVQSVRPHKLFLDKRPFTMHLWFNYTGSKNPSYKKYLFRIMALDPIEGYNTSGKTGYVECYLLGNKIYFEHKYGINYSFNATGSNYISSLGNPNISISVDVISKEWYNNIDTGSYYDDWPVANYWCNVAISYDATYRIMCFYYNGKLVLKTDKYGNSDFAKYLMYYITIGFGSYTNRNTNWNGYISHIYISNVNNRYGGDAIRKEFYPGAYFPIRNVSTKLPLDNYSNTSSSKIDANGLKIWTIHDSENTGILTNTEKEAPIFDDSKNLTSNALFNGKKGIYSEIPMNLSDSSFTIDFWALSTSTKTKGYETLLKIIPNNPKESITLSNGMYQKKSFYSYKYENNKNWTLDLYTIEIFYDYEYGRLWFVMSTSERLNKPSYPVFDNTHLTSINYNIDDKYLTAKYSQISWATIDNLDLVTNGIKIDSWSYMSAGDTCSIYTLMNKWIHIALVYNCIVNKIFLYINGYLIKFFDVSRRDFINQHQNLLIGMDRLDNTYKWNGYIRDFNITSGVSKYMDTYIPGMRAIQELSNMPSFNGNLRDNITFSGDYNSSSISWSIKGKPVLKDTSTLKTFNIVKNKPVDKATYLDGSVIYFEEKKLPMFKKDWTLEFWSKFEGSGTRYLFRASAAHPSISMSGTTMPDFSIYYSSSGILYFKLQTIKSSSSSSAGSASSKFSKNVSLALMKEKWCHIAVSYIAETKTFYFYVNGALQFIQESSIELAEEMYYLYIGGQFKDNSSYNWIGYLRDFEFTSGKAKYTEDTIPHIYALPTLTNFTAILPFTNNLDDTYGNKWITKSEPEVKDIGKEIFTFSVKKNGKFSNGLYLDGNAGLYSESTVELFTKNCTISFWAYFSGTTNVSKYLLEVMPVHPEESSSGYTLPCLEVVYNNNFIRCNLYTITGRDQKTVYGYNEKFSLYTSLPTLKTKWHHIAIVYTVSNSKFYFYVDGQLVGTEVSYLDLTFFPYHIWVGMYYNTTNKYDWEGYIRNLEIYGTQAKYTSNTISAIYAEPDLDITHKHKIRRLLAGLIIHNFKTKKFNAINAPTLYNFTVRKPVRTDRNKWLSRRFLKALRSSFFNVKRRKSRTQVFQINDTKRLLAKYLEFKFNVAKDVERTRKAIGIYIRALQ